MKILAVSDEPSLSLETLIADDPKKFGDIDMIVSCGDLDTEYIEYLVDSIKRDLFFIRGNHPLENSGEYFEPEKTVFTSRGIKYVAGYADLHGRVEIYNNYIIAGFGGSIWYNGEENQYTEEEMAKVVKSVTRSIAWQRLQDKLMRRQRKEVIVVSHAPILAVHDLSDRPHRGFKCFKNFIDKVSPLLWLHGHIHLLNQYTNQISVVGNTTVVNSFGCKVIDINRKNIQVVSHCFL
jgi:uncharacterized protein